MTTQMLGIGAILLIALGLFLIAFAVLASKDSLLNRLFNSYITRLDNDLRFIRSNRSGKIVFLLQALAIVADGLFSFFYHPLLLVIIPGLIVGPSIQLKNLRDKRILRIETQLDGWLLILANALKAVPAIGDALVSSRTLCHAPISEEVDIAIKENQLGAPLDDALRNMGNRINSRVVTAALTMLSVARKTGGDLPSTLETSAASLREMARLEGVIRTKTADGRNQAFVLGSLPAVLMVGLYFAYPILLEKLFNTAMGNVLLGVAIALWIGAVVVALKILNVDI